MVWKLTALAWAALIFYFSTATFGGAFTSLLLRQILEFLHVRVSPGAFATFHFLVRKLAHLTVYAIFAMLLYGSSEDEHPFDWRPWRALGCVLLAGAYSLTDEFHQRFVPGRGPSLADCGIDTSGAALGMLVFYGRGVLLAWWNAR